MDNSNQYKGWMAEQIAKTYLFETELLEVYQQSNQQNFDFVCMLKSDFKISFAVEVKSSKYSKSDILRVYRNTRQKLLMNEIPILMLYINYIDRTGYFEFLVNKLNENLEILTTQNLKKSIKELSLL